ncbi:DUF3990 domain-containing protein [Bradyrhizobium sp. USDA 4451]
MPQWSNKDLIVYHGTDSQSVRASGITSGSSLPLTINLALCRPRTDFGQGFYVTTSLHQAEQWANRRAMGINLSVSPPSPPAVAVIIQFTLSRDDLAALESLSFVLETPDFWALVSDCRIGFPPHQRVGASAAYDVVYGPVTLWPQLLVIKDCDQISFHTTKATAVLKRPIVFKKANDSDPKRTLF